MGDSEGVREQHREGDSEGVREQQHRGECQWRKGHACSHVHA